jgi:hypothetical protein
MNGPRCGGVHSAQMNLLTQERSWADAASTPAAPKCWRLWIGQGKMNWLRQRRSQFIRSSRSHAVKDFCCEPIPYFALKV